MGVERGVADPNPTRRGPQHGICIYKGDHPTTDLYPQGTENGFFVANTAEGQPSRQGGTKVGGGDPGRGNGETRGDGRPQGGRGGPTPQGKQEKAGTKERRGPQPERRRGRKPEAGSRGRETLALPFSEREEPFSARKSACSFS